MQGESGEVDGVQGDWEEAENVPSEGGQVGDDVEGETVDEVVESPQVYDTNLPIEAHQRNLLELIEENRVVCVEGQTACGKSTRVPLYILDHALSLSPPHDCRVLVTQPRRMADFLTSCGWGRCLYYFV